jgi:hypothetical protein
MIWAGHVARGRDGMRASYLREIRKEIVHKEDQELGWCIIVRWILKIQGGVVWSGLIWLRIGNCRGLL